VRTVFALESCAHALASKVLLSICVSQKRHSIPLRGQTCACLARSPFMVSFITTMIHPRWSHNIVYLLNTYSAFSSFPDSALFDSGSEVHSFRIAYPSAAIPGTEPPESTGSLESNTSGGVDSSLHSESDGFLYGFALFHQRRDESSKRGYLQVSTLPFPFLVNNFIPISGSGDVLCLSTPFITQFFYRVRGGHEHTLKSAFPSAPL
jgi:hypothetical protein